MRRNSTLPISSRAALGLTAVMALLSACSASADDLIDEVAGKPGVIDVDAREEDAADDDIPFSTVPQHVQVLMEEDATSAEVMAIFDAYDDEIDDGDVMSVEVTLDGPKAATLSSGERVHPTPESVDDLLGAQSDSTVLAYRRDSWPSETLVHLELAPTDFTAVTARADRYTDLPGPSSVTVVSGRFVLIRDGINEDLRITRAREELVQRLDSRFTLRGVVVSGSGPLEVIVAPAQKQAVRRFVSAARNEEVGKVVIRTARDADY